MTPIDASGKKLDSKEVSPAALNGVLNILAKSQRIIDVEWPAGIDQSVSGSMRLCVKTIYHCFFIRGLILTVVSSISIPPQQIQWRNPKGDVYSPFEKRGYYHKAVLQLQVPPNLQGSYYIE